MAGQSPPASADMVGFSFVRQYYTLLNNNPGSLHRFYKENSVYTHGTEKETLCTLRGQRSIEEKISQLGLQDCKADISNIDCQESLNEGVMVMVMGTLTNAGQTPRRFSQTFFLAVQPNGYFVLNDIFRYLVDPFVPGAPTTNQLEASPVAPGFPNGVPAPHEPAQPTPAPEPVPTQLQSTFLPDQPPAAVEVEPTVQAEPEPANEPHDTELVDEPAADVLEAEAEPEAPPTEETEDSSAASAKPVPTKPSAPLSWASLAAKNCPTAPVPQPKPPKAETDADTEGADENATGDADRVESQQQCVVVKGIATTVSEDDLRTKMEEFGAVSKVNCYFNTGGKTGYAFVEFSSCDGIKLLLSAPEDRLKIEGHECTLKVEEKRGKLSKGAFNDKGGRGRGRGEGKGRSTAPNGANNGAKGPRADADSNAPSGGRGGKGRGDGSYSGGRGEGKGTSKDGKGRGRGGSKRSDSQ